ncbi:MAG: hypothetical protein LC108_15795, partial [Anaerolineales bacterium]|nr:hypothetical protein [Anaerolineales bacterium]
MMIFGKYLKNANNVLKLAAIPASFNPLPALIITSLNFGYTALRTFAGKGSKLEFMNKKKRYFLFVLAISAVLGCYLLLGSFGIELDRRETTVSDSEGLMAIDPDRILQLISHNPDQAFTPIFDLDYPTYRDSVSEIEPVLWGQSDYLSIVETFFQVNWKDELANWELYDIYFSLSCSDADKMQYMQYADYTFHRILKNAKGPDTRIERRVYVQLHESLLEWGETEYSPDYSSHRYYDLSQVKISAEEALR